MVLEPLTRLCTTSGRLQLSARLGFPDFEPATSSADEDELTDDRLKSGWSGRADFVHNAQFDEYGSMEDSFSQQWQQIQHMREMLGIPEPREASRRHKRMRAKSDLFPEPGGNVDGGLHAWLARLADPQISLAQLLEKGVPYVPPGRSGLHSLVTSRTKNLLDLLSSQNQSAGGGAGGGGWGEGAGGRHLACKAHPMR